MREICAVETVDILTWRATLWDLEVAEREAGPGRRRKVQFEGMFGAEDVGMVYVETVLPKVKKASSVVLKESYGL